MSHGRFMFEQLIQSFETIHPVFFLIGLIVCPLLPIPVSPLWVLAGMRFGPVMGITICAVGLLINFSIAYVLSRYLIRRQIEWLLKKWKMKIPSVSHADHAKLTLLVRIVPGNPLFAQNYLLGLAGVRFSSYLIIGFVVQMFYATGFVVFGEAVFEGRFGLILFALLLILSAGIVVKMLARRLLRSKEMEELSTVKE